jgi:hypothetical protein
VTTTRENERLDVMAWAPAFRRVANAALRCSISSAGMAGSLGRMGAVIDAYRREEIRHARVPPGLLRGGPIGTRAEVEALDRAELRGFLRRRPFVLPTGFLRDRPTEVWRQLWGRPAPEPQWRPEPLAPRPAIFKGKPEG